MQMGHCPACWFRGFFGFLGHRGLLRMRVVCIRNITGELGNVWDAVLSSAPLKAAVYRSCLSDAANGLCENSSFAPSGLAHFPLSAPRLAPVGCILSPLRGFLGLNQLHRTGCGTKFSHATKGASSQTTRERHTSPEPPGHCAGANFRVRVVSTETGRPFMA